MKGQSAIEYLVTYGWMLLAVGLVGGIAFDSFRGACTSSFTGFYTDTVNVDNFGTTTNGQLQLAVKNDRFQSINIQKFNVSSEEANRFKILNTTVSPGAVGQITMPGYDQGSSCEELKVIMNYDKGSLKSQQIEGTIRAPLQIEDVEKPDAPTSLSLTA